MLRFLLRFVGLVCLACGFAALIVDGTRSIAADGLVISSVGEALVTFAPTKLAGIEALARATHPILWNPIATVLLRIPVWLLAGLLGGALFAITARRRVLVGHSSR